MNFYLHNFNRNAYRLLQHGTQRLVRRAYEYETWVLTQNMLLFFHDIVDFCAFEPSKQHTVVRNSLFGQYSFRALNA